jgi:hypothetical protein
MMDIICLQEPLSFDKSLLIWNENFNKNHFSCLVIQYVTLVYRLLLKIALIFHLSAKLANPHPDHYGKKAGMKRAYNKKGRVISKPCLCLHQIWIYFLNLPLFY